MPKLYISLDYANQEVEIYQKLGEKIVKKALEIDKEEPLKKEISEFIRLVKTGVHETGYAAKAKDALELALKIQKQITR